MKMNPVVHFEMPYEDRERVAKFYQKAFGWETQMMGEDMGNYVLAMTTETDEKRMVKKPGAINGGFYPRAYDPKERYSPRIVIAVDDIMEAIKNVKKEGGMVEDEPMDIPGVGRFVIFADTEGNYVGMIQSVNM
ncbi:MAG: VOC family protein [Candidatus Pacebacteria bacterium]|nr:VOC family protein [Candidatus Paceibacterota bacterium]